jgi:hypothetical protein
VKSRILLGVACCVFSAGLAGCDFFSSLFWADVGAADAQTATDAVMNTCQAVFDTCTIDEGSTGSLIKGRNDAGTLHIEASYPVAVYPRTRKYIAQGYVEPITGYTLSGSVFVTWPSVEPNTCSVDLELSHPTLPVRRIVGDLTRVSSVSSGTLKFNSDTYYVSDLVEHFFSH